MEIPFTKYMNWKDNEVFKF